jgi:hypothetical protein
VFEKKVGLLATTHGSPAHACTLLPGNRVAISRGNRSGEKIADLTVLSLADGSEDFSAKLPAGVFDTKFVPSALRADPQGKLVAVLGFYHGLLLVDLETGQDVSASYAPHPYDDEDDGSIQHGNHRYSDLAFDEQGMLLAATYAPGKFSVWARSGEVLRRENVAVNPKAHSIITFDNEGVAFFDSFGAAARFRIDR